MPPVIVSSDHFTSVDDVAVTYFSLKNRFLVLFPGRAAHLHTLARAHTVTAVSDLVRLTSGV